MNRTIFTLLAASAVIALQPTCVFTKSPLGDRFREMTFGNQSYARVKLWQNHLAKWILI
jgi:hypothetical protein